VEWGETLLCDAGLVNNLPANLARAGGAHRIVAVDLSDGLPPCRADAVGMEILLRVQEITTRLGNRRCAAQADVVIVPQLDGRSWLDTTRLPDVMAEGERATRERLPQIRALLSAPAGRRAI
jgi:NTE family protein